MDREFYRELVIYSPVLAITGYLLFYTGFFVGPYASLILAGVSLLGSVIFLNYIRDENRLWWVGIFYPMLLVLIIIVEIFTAVSQGVTYGPGMTTGRFREMVFFLVAPFSLFFFAAMPADFRKIMRFPIIIAAIIGVMMLVPFCDDVANVYFPAGGGNIAGSDITGGFIFMIVAGFYGLPALMILAVIYGLKVSGIIRSRLETKS